jgi:hypothetical protein
VTNEQKETVMVRGRRLRRAHEALLRRVVRGGTPDRGDVPGWVLVTMMTAGLVAGLWAMAGDALNDLFRNAVTGVGGP